MFDHKAFATDGMYPGLASTLSVATRGTFIERLFAVVGKAITATTEAYKDLVGKIIPKTIFQSTAVDSGLQGSVDNKYIMGKSIETSIRPDSSSSRISATSDYGNSKVTTKRKRIKAS